MRISAAATTARAMYKMGFSDSEIRTTLQNQRVNPTTIDQAMQQVEQLKSAAERSIMMKPEARNAQKLDGWNI